MDRERLGDFLRARREALQPEDVGLPRGPRRRTSGLRREEVAALSGVSADYYSRIEQSRGPVPSEQVLSGIAHGLRLTLEERDRLVELAGHATPRRARGDHVDAGLMRILDGLAEAPAQVENVLGVTLRQTRLAALLLGDETSYTGPERVRVNRWFADPRGRDRVPEEDHARHGRTLVSRLAAVEARTGPDSPAGELATLLRGRSTQFARLWDEHPVLGPYCEPKRLNHPDVGLLELHGQTLLDPDQHQALTVFTAVPGTESHERLRLLSVVGAL
ncbi:helix-turn-helix transcriptional regulator [Promicromonospora sp. NPDC052451]|uniref:helix-turn-helix transcriptional regulator n=1 Tax=Promicromonospora sp. NPDC052451 TaxID=3364407 RepID=UPI0037C5652E